LLFALPIVFSTVLFIDGAIVIIVQLNDWVFTKTTVIHNGTRSIGAVHTGDYVLHYLPAIEILLFTAFYSDLLRAAYKKFTKTSGNIGSLSFYKVYVHVIGVAIILLYCITMDFQTNYPVGDTLNASTIILSSCVVSLLIGFLFYSLLSSPDPLNRAVQEKSLGWVFPND
jgi:hypothetical protein